MSEEILNDIIDGETREMPLVPLRGKVLFPGTILNFDVGRSASVKAVNSAGVNGEIFIAAQKNALIDNPLRQDICEVGVVARIKQIIKIQNGTIKTSVQALYRARRVFFSESGDFFVVHVIKYDYQDPVYDIDTEANLRFAKSAFYDYAVTSPRIPREAVNTIMEFKNPHTFIDNACSVVNFADSLMQQILEENDVILRLQRFSALFKRESEIAKIEKKVADKVKEGIDKSQKEFYLREQIKAIHSELGDNEDEKEKLIEDIKAKKLLPEVEEKVLKEISRLDKINPSSPDYSVILNYIDWIKEIPFNEKTEDTSDIATAKAILDADHFGLEKVKDRILEYIAVLKLTKKVKGPILCFVGPPGVGKTSVATSIARALGRKFVRMSLGGVKDEAEIRGHRKTYVGAMPGRIMYGLKTAKSANPVFLLDEIDKLSSDIHGDPASALLEVLDPEQNSTFRDRYMEIPYDLSDVIFITTANTVETIPYPLLDRMELIELTGYTQEEKLQIAKRYLVPKQLKNNGLSESKVEFTDGALREIIEGYTMEAGVRNLEREIGGVIRKIATIVAEKPKTRKKTVKAEDIAGYLGRRKRVKDEALEKDEVGCATALAWTSVGGTTLAIEVALLHGKGDILLTGKLGDVMKESARAAISYIRSRAEKYGIKDEVFENTDIHIHVPEGATAKDGPSAGITMATAILSAFTKKTVKKSVAMTGEITLRGKVLAIGGLKEKALAAYRLGIKTVIIPKDNVSDLEDIPKEIRKEIKFVPVKNVEEVFNVAINF